MSNNYLLFCLCKQLTRAIDQIRALMDKSTNIRNMSVIAHGTSYQFSILVHS